MTSLNTWFHMMENQQILSVLKAKSASLRSMLFALNALKRGKRTELT